MLHCTVTHNSLCFVWSGEVLAGHPCHLCVVGRYAEVPDDVPLGSLHVPEAEVGEVARLEARHQPGGRARVQGGQVEAHLRHRQLLEQDSDIYRHPVHVPTLGARQSVDVSVSVHLGRNLSKTVDRTQILSNNDEA